MGSIFSELWAFMRVRKKWWLGPILVTMVLLSALIVLALNSCPQSSSLMALTLRVETPCTYISINAVTSAFSLR